MMTREERAKQFMAFDAMKGLQEALRDREERHSRVDRHDISDEQIERNNLTISRIRKGMRVSIDCYYAFHDEVKEGIVSDINIIYKYVRIGEERIPFEDIYSIEIIEL